MLEPIIRHYAWNLDYARALTHDVPEDLWARSGGDGLENHPAWTIGHLITGSALVAAGLGTDPAIPEAWRDLFQRNGPDDTRRPDPDVALYPSRSVLFPEFERLHALVAAALPRVDAKEWHAPTEWRFGGYLPTELDAALFMLIGHEGIHLGQLGCWRRRFGLPSAMSSMGNGASMGIGPWT